jgi:predicted amidohydrolase
MVLRGASISGSGSSILRAMLRAAIIQMVSSEDVNENVATARELIAAAAGDGARLVALPEFFALISQDARIKLQIQEEFGSGPLQQFLAGEARRHGIWLVGGSIPLRSPEADRAYNSCLVFSDAGECVARYDKLHLFDVHVDPAGGEQYNESATMKHGNSVAIARTPYGNIGLSLCYDLRFPELYRRMLDDDVVMFTAPSAFTAHTGSRHWELMLRARAVENLCFMIAPGQGGRHNAERTTWGHSMIIDPWGDVLCCIETGPGFACADLDMERLRELRRSFPALEHRRL